MGKITEVDDLEDQDQDHFKQVILRITFQDQDHFYQKRLFEVFHRYFKIRNKARIVVRIISYIKK